MSGVHIVWFKKDLRVHDHAALNAAAASNAPVIPLYIFEPGYWALPEHSQRQFSFLLECLDDLNASLLQLGAPLIVRTGDAVDILSALHRKFGVEAIHCHEESGLQWSFDRDRAVHRWARNAGISVREQPQNGVQRGLNFRQGWEHHWQSVMRRPRLVAPESLRSTGVESEPLPLAEDFGLGPDDCPGREKGGRRAGVESLRDLQSIWSAPSQGYGTSGCAGSSLSAHLAFGTVSMREAWQGARRIVETRPSDDASQAASMAARFASWLSSRARDFQQLEDQTTLDSRNLHPAHDGVRPQPAVDDPRLNAWLDGRTGFPFLDACMRSLRATGQLGCEDRSSVLAFATQHLWMDWKAPARGLAARLTDFEPAIHFAEARNLSAITNAPRIFNPVKQSRDQDPSGAFIRRWVPELSALPDQWLHAPWEAPASIRAQAGIVLGQSYPMRMVDHMAAAQEARSRIAALGNPRRDSRQGDLPFPRHRPALRAKGRATPEPAQLSFDLPATEVRATRFVGG